MNKLFNLKSRFTVSEAAKYLAHVFDGEEVTDADVLQLGLEKHLVLSIELREALFARPCKSVPPLPTSSVNGMPHADEFVKNPDPRIKPYDVETTDEVVVLNPGDWDLPIIGSETEKIRSEYLVAIGKKDDINIGYLVGSCVSDFNGQQYEIQEVHYDPEDPDKLITDDMYCSGSLPENATIFIRKKSLDQFIQSQTTTKNEEDKAEHYQSDCSKYPQELQTAIAVYYEFWHEKPDDNNPATKETIAQFISEYMGNKVEPKGALFERIDAIAKPGKAKTGGAPRSEWRTYKGKSKENL